MARVFNFSAGPAVLPEVVLKQAALEMSEYQDYGMSVMEMSHRSRAYMDIHAEASSLLRKLMNIPDDYAVLFLQGGASLQFSMVPMNIMTSNKKFDIINTGVWTQKAIVEGRKLGQVNVVASSQEEGFSFIPDVDNISFSHDADYVHICYNNTIYGTKYIKIPDTGNLPLVCDMSSCILSEPYDVSKYGIIFAGAQKNIGPAGVTIVIIKKDLLSRSSDDLATMLNYKVHAESDSLYNTPPTYAIYISMLVFR
ncbi:MAG TPA: 3-phosphoserine/phosphohydroxythreonine transaminase, partial [Spirochaetota bacterium]|nr:3-phosphoserine/phosphohydroxythreonine transaminase [Spirochaetota bacterium]